MRLQRSAVAMAMLAGSLFRPAGAQENEEKKVQWKLSGEVRIRPEWRNNQDLNSQVDDQTSEVFMRFRLGVEATIKEDFRVFIQAQDSRVWGEETSTISNEQNLDLHQGYLEVKDLGVKGLSFSVGRQEWTYGDQRLIGNLNWSNVGRSFDGARVRWQLGKFTSDLLWAEITNRLVAGATTGADLLGVYTQSRPRAGAEYEGYLLGYANRIEAPGETGAPGSSHVYGLGARAKDRFGGFDFTLEAVVERGDFNGDDLRAEAFGTILGWTWWSATKTRAFGGYDYATGDHDNTDGEQNQFFNFFPTNHPLYGYMDYEGWRNIKSPYAGVSLIHGRHFYQVKGHHFDLQSASGPWQDAGGAILGFDPAGNSGTDVGNEVDLSYRFDWREKAKVEVGLSRFWPGQFAENTRGGDASDWGYIQLTWGF
ncbi:MAG: alginate export family protein [Acidobacteria bacterium]|nr:alginate export family protein [Acidobacteriota bacterium]MCI0568552.1 alginate export family protein [Acidobacteriota bacterium]